MQKVKTVKKLRIKKSVLYKSLFWLFLILSLLFLGMFIRLNILPFLYLGGLILILVLINLADLYLLGHQKTRKFGVLYSLFFVFIFGVGICYQSVTFNFLHNLSFLNIETQTYYLITLKDSTYHSLEDLNSKTLAFVNTKGVMKVQTTLDKEINYHKKEKDNSSSLITSLLANDVDAILMEENEVFLYQEMEHDFNENTKVLKSFSVDFVKEDIKKEVEINKIPFNIYITGIDTYGNLNKVSRSDVNIIATVNPNTHKILLTAIPRDYYVQLHGTTGLKDKLTHAGLKGIDMSIQTIEDLLSNSINYYVKINFTSFTKIIDAIGGIDIEVPFAFSANYQEEDGSYVYYDFQEGMQHLNGEEALAYSRERYNLREGDVGRAKHQQQVIEAMVKQCLSAKILTNYASIIGAIEGNFATNLELANITSFIQKQIKEMPTWTIEKQVLTGIDSSELTYTFPKGYGYVMLPSEDSVNEAIKKINDVMEKS